MKQEHSQTDYSKLTREPPRTPLHQSADSATTASSTAGRIKSLRKNILATALAKFSSKVISSVYSGWTWIKKELQPTRIGNLGVPPSQTHAQTIFDTIPVDWTRHRNSQIRTLSAAPLLKSEQKPLIRKGTQNTSAPLNVKKHHKKHGVWGAFLLASAILTPNIVMAATPHHSRHASGGMVASSTAAATSHEKSYVKKDNGILYQVHFAGDHYFSDLMPSIHGSIQGTTFYHLDKRGYYPVEGTKENITPPTTVVQKAITQTPTAQNHIGTSALPVSPKTLDIIKKYEGSSLVGYQDRIGRETHAGRYDILIGWGHKDPLHRFKVGDRITTTQAQTFLYNDVKKITDDIERKAPAVAHSLNQNQLGAIVDFCFNVSNWTQTSVWHAVERGKFEDVPKDLIRYTRAGGKYYSRLAQRRREEVNLWRMPVSEGPRFS